MASIGSMDTGMFVGKGDLLLWMNDLLGLKYTSIEQLGNGAAYCQIMDSIYPGEVAMRKVDFNAKLEHDILKNYKVLQNFFEKKKIAKVIEVNKLLRAKQLDNLEMLQWMKRYHSIHYSGQPYNAVERRNGGNKENETKANSKRPNVVIKTVPSSDGDVSTLVSEGAPMVVDGVDEGIEEQRTNELAKLSIIISDLEKERDFFFAKLREIETYIQLKEDPHTEKMCDDLKRILYNEPSDTDMETSS